MFLQQGILSCLNRRYRAQKARFPRLHGVYFFGGWHCVNLFCLLTLVDDRNAREVEGQFHQCNSLFSSRRQCENRCILTKKWAQLSEFSWEILRPILESIPRLIVQCTTNNASNIPHISGEPSNCSWNVITNWLSTFPRWKRSSYLLSTPYKRLICIVRTYTFVSRLLPFWCNRISPHCNRQKGR